jgi:hypothetical protein
MNTTTRLDYGECRKRLCAITTDAAILDSFDRLAECTAAGDDEAFDDAERMARADEALDGFLSDDLRLNISLDYIFGGRGKPFLSPEVAA